MTSPLPPATEDRPLDLLDTLTPVEAADFGELFPRAVDLFHRDGRVSVSALEQNLGVNACRAARMCDAMERIGLVAPEVRPRPRAAAVRPLGD